MFVQVLVTLFAITKAYPQAVAAQGECTDQRGRLIAHGEHFVPGPDICNLCVCVDGLPKACKAALCTPPQDCRKFRVGNKCCEFICLDDDDVVQPADGSEGRLRMAAGGALLAVALLTVVLVVCLVCKKKRPHADYQRNITGIGSRRG